MEKCDLLIKNTIVMKDYETLCEHTDIAVKNGIILNVCPTDTEIYEAQEELDGRELLYMPGLIDSHMHTGQQLLKGAVLDAKPVIWTRIMLPFESELTPDLMRLSAEAAALEMIRSGTTGFVDAGSYFMEEAAAVYYQSGLRGCLSYSTMDEPGLPKTIANTAEEAVKRNDELYQNWHGKGNLKVYYALRALNSCSDKLIQKVAEHANEKDAMIQAHMNEYQEEITAFTACRGILPYVYLHQTGILSEKFLGAHSLLLSAEEKELIEKTGARICHCPFSNCGKALPETLDLLSRGIVPGFGTDGAAHGGLSLWNEMRIFRSLMSLLYGVPRKNSAIMPAETIFRMMFEGGAAAISEQKTGRIERGYRADLIAVDLNQAIMMPSCNLLHTLLECTDGAAIQNMIVDGKILMRNREILTLDEERILFELRQYMKNKRREKRWNTY